MQIRLMTSNIWGEYFGNPAGPRAPLLTKVFERYAPDILGLQEVCPHWWDSSLIPALSDKYAMSVAQTDEDVNYTPLFYRKERLELLSASRYLFHMELDPSKGWNYGVFRERLNRKVFAVFNTHFWWKPELRDDVIRRYNAMEMTAEMESIGRQFSCPVFFMGDLNCTCDSMAWNYLESHGWKTSFQCTEDYSSYSSHHGNPVIHPDGTCSGCTTEEPKERSIDHIGIPAGIKVLRQCAVIDREALDSSDHSPVYADVDF